MFGDFPWRHWRDANGEAVALVSDDENLSWRALCVRVDALAQGFQAQGIVAGDGVALWANNSVRALLAWLALLQCGARVLPLNPKLPETLLRQLLPGLTLRYGVSPDAVSALPGLPMLEWRTSAVVMTESAVAWDARRLASMTLTSGSTGLPKAAVHTAAAHLASAEGVLALMPFGKQDNWLLSLPLFHVSGQGILWRWLLAGGSLTVRERLALHEQLVGCTHASLVPTQLWRLLTQQQIPVTLRSVLLGGAAIPVELTEQAQALGIQCWCGYGLTELASTVCAKRADGLADVGQALPGREVRVQQEEIQIRAKSLASGYWRDGALVPVTDDAGWFHTRDRGVLDGKKLTVLGRLDNLFFSGGEGIQPEDVERVIHACPGVSHCFVVPIADAEFGHRPVAVVECTGVFSPQALAQWVSGRLVRFQQPIRWLLLPQALKTGGIKISRREVQRWVEQSLASENAPPKP